MVKMQHQSLHVSSALALPNSESYVFFEDIGWGKVSEKWSKQKCSYLSRFLR